MSGMFYIFLYILALSCVSFFCYSWFPSLFPHLSLPPPHSLPSVILEKKKTGFLFLPTYLVWVPGYFSWDIVKFDSLVSLQMKNSKICTHEFTFHFLRILSIWKAFFFFCTDRTRLNISDSYLTSLLCGLHSLSLCHNSQWMQIASLFLEISFFLTPNAFSFF